jgi:hypothetical protein
MAKEDKGKKGESNTPITNDERFKSVHNDPRFNLPKLRNFKVKVDERFSKKELKKLNSSATGKKVKIDRYGRKLKASDAEKDLDKYYEHEEDKQDSDASSSEEASQDDEELKSEEKPKEVKLDESGSESEPESDNVESVLDKARGEGLASSSESDSDSDSSDESDNEVEFEEDSEIELEDTKPEEGEPTKSFAVVNLDWDNIRAVDLMATLISFVPKSGIIKSVTIFPSEFGKQQMQKEEIEGPPKELFKSKKKVEVESDSDSDDELDVNNADDLERAARKLYQEDDGEEDYDNKALRRYQLQRLRYYYAVVRCDSVATAREIYSKCDGSEFESTANILDLRYIPDGVEFEESDATDSCTKVPSTYKPNSTFVTDALQHSKVKLTWDETPKERLQLSSRQFSQREIDDMDFKAYLASDSDESEAEEANKMKNKYKSLLGGNFEKVQQDDDDEGEVDMEITFNPGLNEAKVEAKDEEEDESTIAAYKRKEKERRKRRMEKFKETQEEEKVVNEKPSKSKNRKNKQEPVDEKAKAELELIMMDENDTQDKPDHFSMRDVIKAEKQNKRKGKKNKKNIDTEMTQDNFEADLNDPRFNEIFEKHEYAIDPTSSEFKKTDTMKKILNERSKRKNNSSSSQKETSNKKPKTSNPKNNEINSLVNKLKKGRK